jgi:hypothetical protein
MPVLPLIEQRMDARFAAMERTIDARFGAMEQTMNERFAAMDARFEQIEEALKVTTQ